MCYNQITFFSRYKNFIYIQYWAPERTISRYYWILLYFNFMRSVWGAETWNYEKIDGGKSYVLSELDTLVKIITFKKMQRGRPLKTRVKVYCPLHKSHIRSFSMHVLHIFTYFQIFVSSLVCSSKIKKLNSCIFYKLRPCFIIPKLDFRILGMVYTLIISPYG